MLSSSMERTRAGCWHGGLAGGHQAHAALTLRSQPERRANVEVHHCVRRRQQACKGCVYP